MLGNKVQRKRRSLARSLERVSVPERRHIGRGQRYLVHPEIALACAPSLRSMAAALRDETVAFDDSDLQAIQSFISDGTGSAFFGRDETAAMREAVGLLHAVLAPKPSVLQSGPVEQADEHLQYQSAALTGS